jgi:hypothetical protein
MGRFLCGKKSDCFSLAGLGGYTASSHRKNPVGRGADKKTGTFTRQKIQALFSAGTDGQTAGSHKILKRSVNFPRFFLRYETGSHTPTGRTGIQKRQIPAKINKQDCCFALTMVS